MIVKHEIKPFNEFWLDCDTETIFSILVSLDEKYKGLAYRNDYTYLRLNATSPNHITFNEIRMIPDISEIQGKYIDYVVKKRIDNVAGATEEIKQYLLEGYYVMAGVDLFYWVSENMCYHNHHVEHYTLLNGYDSDNNLFYTMETDNEKYREFVIDETTLQEAMAEVTTLRYHVIVFRVKENKLKEGTLYSVQGLRKNAKKIIKSIRPLLNRDYWMFHSVDYQKLFYRDMTVMYLMQINCRANANALMFAYLAEQEENAEYRQLEAKAKELESGWIEVRRAVSKLYFKPDAGKRMIEQNKLIQILLKEEKVMWKHFLEVTKKKRV